VIGRLSGILLAKQPPHLMIDVHGVGYEVEAPMSTFFRLPAVGDKVTLETHLVVREDAQLLFGFASAAEKSLFRELIKLSGIGPKVALAVLSGLSVEDFWAAMHAGEIGRLVKVPGIGKKTAERIVIELRDRSASASVLTGGSITIATTPLAESRAALESLGYKPAEAQKMAEGVHQDGMTTDQIIREALKRAVR